MINQTKECKATGNCQCATSVLDHSLIGLTQILTTTCSCGATLTERRQVVRSSRNRALTTTVVPNEDFLAGRAFRMAHTETGGEFTSALSHPARL